MFDDEVMRLVASANAARATKEPTLTEAELALELRFACNQRLAVYGTLAPGACNHHELEMCRGTWSDGAVRGRRAMRNYPVFTPEPTAALVPMKLLTSVDLTLHWARLDAFEGPAYRRILVPVLAAGHSSTVANLYAAVDAVR